MLLDCDAEKVDVFAVDDYGSTGFLLAFWEKQEEVIKILLTSGKFDVENHLEAELINTSEGKWQFKMPFYTKSDQSGQLMVTIDDLHTPENIEIQVNNDKNKL